MAMQQLDRKQEVRPPSPRSSSFFERLAHLAMIGLVCSLLVGVSGGWWFFSRYEADDLMNLPLEEMSAAEYPEDPSIKSQHHGKYQERELTLIQRDDTHFDFILESDNEQIAKIHFKNIDVSLMTPSVPEWTKGDEGLIRVALTDREWNRQQVRFPLPSEHVEVLGGDGLERKSLTEVALAKNCLNAGLWEVLLFHPNEQGEKALLYQGWFTFPMGHYKRLMERNTQISYWKHWYKLEHWSDPAGTVINLEPLREVISEANLEVQHNPQAAVLSQGEQRRKLKNIFGQKCETWQSLQSAEDITFASFHPPGYYEKSVPWGNEYWRIAQLQETILREVITPASDEVLHEVELVYTDASGNETCRFLVGGVDLDSLPQLSTDEYPHGLYMPMGIGVPPFYQTYEDLQKNLPHESPFYSFLLDQEDRWIDHHTVAIDGPVLHQDLRDPNVVHLYLLSYERHCLVTHLKLKLPPSYSPSEPKQQPPRSIATRPKEVR
ncbi:Hypothetical protein PBC10988_33350 [Planctomycetales bacterium 10988]|nr:Hypothetical protein PBC10988_33350 [Planctomycetales bacterium 10988]